MSARPEFEIEALDGLGNTVQGPIAFSYPFPFIDESTSARTVKQKPIGREPVVQYMGPEAKQIDIQGHCYADEASFLDRLTEDGLVSIVSDRWNGTGIVESVKTTATGEGGGPRGGTENRIYEYTLTIIEIGQELPTATTP